MYDSSGITAVIHCPFFHCQSPLNFVNQGSEHCTMQCMQCTVMIIFKRQKYFSALGAWLSVVDIHILYVCVQLLALICTRSSYLYSDPA